MQEVPLVTLIFLSRVCTHEMYFYLAQILLQIENHEKQTQGKEIFSAQIMMSTTTNSDWIIPWRNGLIHMSAHKVCHTWAIEICYLQNLLKSQAYYNHERRQLGEYIKQVILQRILIRNQISMKRLTMFNTLDENIRQKDENYSKMITKS